MVDMSLLKQKLGMLNEYLTDLHDVREDSKITLALFKADKKLRRYVERTLHLAVECCLDIGGHIIADEKFREPQNNNKDIFVVLAENRVLPESVLPALQKMAQFRNLLVHDYARLDPEILYTIIKKNLGDIENFAAQVNKKYL